MNDLNSAFTKACGWIILLSLLGGSMYGSAVENGDLPNPVRLLSEQVQAHIN